MPHPALKGGTARSYGAGAAEPLLGGRRTNFDLRPPDEMTEWSHERPEDAQLGRASALLDSVIADTRAPPASAAARPRGLDLGGPVGSLAPLPETPLGGWPESRGGQPSLVPRDDQVGVRRRGSSGSNGSNKMLDIIQFSAPIYFVEENEGYLEVDIMRLGLMTGCCEVSWHTEDSTAISGARYVAAKGNAWFDDKEATKSIRLEIIADRRWETTQEFKITLTNPRNCELGNYLHHCRVKVIDNDVFPSIKFREFIEEGEEGIERISAVKLFYEFFKLCFDTEKIGRRTLWMISLNQLENLYVLFTLYVNIYLVDVIFNMKPEAEHKLLLPSREDTSVLIGILYILPMFVLHLVDFRQVRLDVGGLAREFVMSNLFRKYLNFSEKTRDMVSPASMQVAILKDSSEIVEGYMSVIELIKSILKLSILTFFILKENSSALVPAILMPTTMALFVVVRTQKLINACEAVAHRTAKLMEIVQEAVNRYTVIAEYLQRPAICALFNQSSEELSKAGIVAEEVKVNNHYFPKWLGPTFIGIYIACYARLVLSGATPLGPFLATIRVFKELSEEFLEMYGQLMTIASTTGPLRKLTWLFNLPTDAPLWKRINRERRERTKVAREAALQRVPENGKKVQFRSDYIPISMVDLCFSYGGTNTVLRDVNITVDQGKMVAVVGTHGSGKRTFLRILGHFLFPDAGHLFIPTYLRIVHVSQEPLMLSLSVWKNLTFGAPHEKPERVLEILRVMGMERTHELAMAELKEAGVSISVECMDGLSPRSSSPRSGGADDDDDQNLCDTHSSEGGEAGEEEASRWQKTLNYVEIAKIHLVRALVVNPEVLVLQRPLLHYDDKEGERIANVLHENVRNQGLCMPKAKVDRRRPRTCFFSPSTKEEAEGADIMWRIDNQNVKEVKKGELSTREMAH